MPVRGAEGVWRNSEPIEPWVVSDWYLFTQPEEVEVEVERDCAMVGPNEFWSEVGQVYVIEATGFGRVKIGWTSGSTYKRMGMLQTGCPFKLRIVAELPFSTRRSEKDLHERFRAHRCGGEWFIFSDEIKSWLAEIATK